MDVIHRTTLEFRRSVHTPDFPEPAWKHSPDMTAVAGVPGIYWKAPADWDAVGAGPEVQTAPEQAATDAAISAALSALNRGLAVDEVDINAESGFHIRAAAEVFNKRDNYIINRLDEVQATLLAIKATTGGTANIRDAIPASFMATNTRTRAATVQDYKDIINAGEVDP